MGAFIGYNIIYFFTLLFFTISYGEFSVKNDETYSIFIVLPIIACWLIPIYYLVYIKNANKKYLKKNSIIGFILLCLLLTYRFVDYTKADTSTNIFNADYPPQHDTSSVALKSTLEIFTLIYTIIYSCIFLYIALTESVNTTKDLDTNKFLIKQMILFFISIYIIILLLFMEI